MKIWFGATTLNFEQYNDNYFAIRNYLIESGHVVLFDWLDKAYDYRQKNPHGSRDIRNIFQEVIQAINESDLVIIEFTVPNFSTSHQINYSLYKHKPTLVLRLHRDNSYPDSYIDAIDSPFLTVQEYSLKSMHDKIDEFIGYSQLERGNGRYNIVLDRREKHYLDWASVKYKKSKSLIIRELIDEKISNDNLYAQYIKS